MYESMTHFSLDKRRANENYTEYHLFPIIFEKIQILNNPLFGQPVDRFLDISGSNIQFSKVYSRIHSTNKSSLCP
jgi:hypothetical protein